MNNTHTPLFPMEDYNKEIGGYVRRIVGPIFEKALKETNKNPMSVGTRGKPYIKTCLYKPHNYRLYFDFNRQGTNTKPFIKTEVKGSVTRLINSKELEYNTKKARVVIKQTQAEVTVKTDRWHVIELSQKAEGQIRKIVNQLDKKAIASLKAFIKRFGGTSQFKVLNRHSEDKVKNEDIIDLLPIKQKWHNKIAKKVYNKKNVEFSSPALASNYITTRAIEDIAPEIAEEIRQIKVNLNPFKYLKKSIFTPLDVLKYEETISGLSIQEKEVLSLYLFEVV